MEIGLRHINSEGWSTFKIIPNGHSRKVKSFVATLGSVRRIQIGWMNQYAKFESERGVGSVVNTVGLDLFSPAHLINGNSTRIEGLDHDEGTVIRCENEGEKWYVGERLVASTSTEKEDGVVQVVKLQLRDYSSTSRSHSTTHPYTPIISIKGQIEITDIELE